MEMGVYMIIAVLYIPFVFPAFDDDFQRTKYTRMGVGSLCSGNWELISTAGDCVRAATALDLQFEAMWDGPGDFPGCLYANDGRDRVYYNISPRPSKLANKRNYMAICQKSKPKQKYGSLPACPPGFIEDIGNVKGGGLMKGIIKDSITDCGEECKNDLRCNSFSYSPTTQECVIYEQINPTDDKYKDFLFCKKPPVAGEQCNRDCAKNPQDNWICFFNFTLSQLFSDSPGRLADGLNRSVLVYNGLLPGPTITVCQGDNVIVKVTNELSGDDETLLGKSFFRSPPNIPANSTTLHFHGIRQKPKSSHHGYSDGGSWSDGVPLVTQCPIPSLESFTYTFLGSGSVDDPYNNAPAGTYWYHSHIGAQRVNGAGGKLIIMPRKKDERFDIDIPDNSLILQEWYEELDQVNPPRNLLVNGKGKQHRIIYKCDEHDCIKKYKKGENVKFKPFANKDYHKGPQANYEVFNIDKPGLKYRFRIIGAFGEFEPVRISIEDHKCTAISADSVDIEPVTDLDALWISIGERYDIVIHTKLKPRDGLPYKINLFNARRKGFRVYPLCSMAWLKYPHQKVDKEYEIDRDICDAMKNEHFTKVLNPVPIKPSIWGKLDDSSQTEYIFPINLTARVQAKDINLSPLNTQYISMPPLPIPPDFNNTAMVFPRDYPDIPFLFQSPSNNTGRCGVVCKEDLDNTDGEFKTQCETLPKMFTCQHVIQQPMQSPNDKTKRWFEIVLTNLGIAVAHPIHHHGGWFNIVGMGQFNNSFSHKDIIDMDKKCEEGSQCLPRNFDRPVFKDTIQVPVWGYVIFRAPIDNAGVSLVHCHIHSHNEISGMAMVFQIGEPHQWSVGPNNKIANENRNNKCFPNRL